MSVPVALPDPASAPGARAWRRHLRTARRIHHTRSLGDVLTDLYILLWTVVVYGFVLVSAVRRHLEATAAAGPGWSPAAVERAWIGVAVLLAGAGLAWRGLGLLGPMLASDAEQVWGLSTPVDRRGWLLPRFGAVLLAAAVTGCVAAVAVALLGFGGRGIGWAALGGAGWGIAGGGLAVVAQGAPSRRRWPGLFGAVLLGGGAAVAAAVVVAAHGGGGWLGAPAAGLGRGLALAAASLAAFGLVGALRALPRLDRPALGAGASVASAAAAATVWVDPTLLSRLLEERRWRRVGRVRSRPFLRPLRGRVWALLQAELRRPLRRPGALAVWGGLALTQYAVAVVAPSLAGFTHVLGAYLAAGLLAGGLRAVARSPGLRRALGGDELTLRLTHLVLPALSATLWWALTLPAAGPLPAGGALLVEVGVVAAAYRAATRPPMSYDEAVTETPFGPFPAGLLLQLARGLDLLALVIVLQFLVAR